VLQTTGNTTLSSTSLSSVASTSGLLVGQGVAGLGIAPGTTISALPGGSVVTLSIAATATITGASVMFGTSPNLYVYPGPSGAFPCTLRYQRQMPQITDTTRVPWFPDQQFLLTRLTAEMMVTTDDERYGRLIADSTKRMGEYHAFADDKTNRAQTVLLDRDRWGRRGWNNLKNTKSIGY